MVFGAFYFSSRDVPLACPVIKNCPTISGKSDTSAFSVRLWRTQKWVAAPQNLLKNDIERRVPRSHFWENVKSVQCSELRSALSFIPSIFKANAHKRTRTVMTESYKSVYRHTKHIFWRNETRTPNGRLESWKARDRSTAPLTPVHARTYEESKQAI